MSKMADPKLAMSKNDQLPKKKKKKKARTVRGKRFLHEEDKEEGYDTA